MGMGVWIYDDVDCDRSKYCETFEEKEEEEEDSCEDDCVVEVEEGRREETDAEAFAFSAAFLSTALEIAEREDKEDNEEEFNEEEERGAVEKDGVGRREMGSFSIFGNGVLWVTDTQSSSSSSSSYRGRLELLKEKEGN